MEHMQLPALRDSQRSVAFRWGSLMALGACALAPISGAPSATGSAPASTALPGSLPTPAPYRTVREIAVRRDPFVAAVVDVPANVSVEAVIVGTRPEALVRIGSRTTIVGVGDVLLGERVSVIDDGGVELSDGAQIPLGEHR